jgi:WD40 repeat protein
LLHLPLNGGNLKRERGYDSTLSGTITIRYEWGKSEGPVRMGLSGKLFRNFGVPRPAAVPACGDRKAVEELCLLLLSQKRRRAQAAGEALAMLSDDGGEVCCDQLFLRENQPLAQLCREQEYLPREPDRRALFWALTGDLSSLQDHCGEDLIAAVARGYLAASWAERIRVSRALAASGRTDLLSAVLSEADGQAALPVRTISLMAAKAAAKGDYDWLAGRLFSFPLPAAYTGSRLLKEACFLPADGDPDYWRALYAAIPGRFEHAHPTGAPPPHMAGGSVTYRRMAINPTGTMLAAGCYDGTIEIWKIPGRRILHTIKAGTRTIRSLEFSGDGTFLACGASDGRVLIINPQDGVTFRQFRVNTGGINALCWLPGNIDLAVGGNDGSLVLVSAQTGDKVRHYNQSSSGITVLVAGKDGRLFSGHDDGTVWGWEPGAKTGNRFASLHRGPVLALTCEKKDAFLVSGSLHGSFLVHSLDNLTQVGSAGTETLNHTALALSSDGTWCATGSRTGEVRVWSLPDGHEIACYRLHRSGIRALAATPDGDSILAGTGAGFLHVVPLQGSRSPVFVKGGTGGIFQLAAAGKEILVSLGWQGIIEVRDLPRGGLIQRLEGRGGTISCISAAAVTGLLAVASPGGLIRLWDLQSRVCQGSIESYLPSITGLSLLKDGAAAIVAGGDGSLLLLRVPDGSVVRQFRGHRGSIHALALDPGNTFFAAGGWDARVHLYPINGEGVPVVLSGHRSPVTGLSFSPEGDILVSCSQDRTLRLWEPVKEQELAVLEGHSRVVSTVAVSPDSRMAVSGSWDKTIRLWSLCDAVCVAVLEGHRDRITSLVFCGNDLLASGDEGGRIAFWTLPDGDLIRMQESNAGGVAGLAVVPGQRHLLSAHKPGLCLSWHLPWNKVPRDSSPADLDMVRKYLRICRESGDPGEGTWKFIEMLLAGELRSSITCCPDPPLAGEYEIELAGGQP